MDERACGRLRQFLFLFLASFALAGCRELETPPKGGELDAWPRTVTDAWGGEATLLAPPQRIIPIFASNTELLHALGLRPQMVAREEMARYPQDVLDLPEVGGRWGFSVEAIAGFEPDLVVLTPARQAAGILAEPLRRIGVPTLVLEHPTVDSIIENALLLGRATGRESAAEALASQWRARMKRLDAALRGREPVSVFLETGSIRGATLSTPRPGSYTWDMLRLAGGRMPWSELGGTGQVSWESVLEADPEFYLVALAEGGVDSLAGRVGWSGMRAAREGKALAVNRAELLIPGPRVFEGIESLARILHPDAFSGGAGGEAGE